MRSSSDSPYFFADHVAEMSVLMEEISSTAEGQRHVSQSIWASLKEALRGSHQDYTTASLNRAIFLLAVWFWRWSSNLFLPWWMCFGWDGLGPMQWLRLA